jgi:hypothetical protein
VLRLKDDPVLPRFGFVICFGSAQTASCPRRECNNSADILTRYRHEDASTVMSEPAMSATAHEEPFSAGLATGEIDPQEPFMTMPADRQVDEEAGRSR